MDGLRTLGIILCAWMLGSLAGGDARAQPSADEQARLASEAEAHERFFRYVTLGDLRDYRSSLARLRSQAAECPLECAEPDCAGLVTAITAADQLDMSLSQMADVLDHLHQLEVRHLASLQGEAVRAEDRFRGSAELLLYQRFLVDVAGHITSTVFVYEDIRALIESGQGGEALNFAYALNELAGDMASLSQGLTSQTGASASTFDQQLAILQSELGNIDNIAGDNGARLNALSIIARRMVALGQAEMERRQAEVDALERDAYRERREVDQALTRTHALAVEAALLRTIAAEARETGDRLAGCAASCGTDTPPAEVLHLFLADRERGNNPDRLDHAAIEDLRTLIARSGRQLREGWAPDCDPEPEDADDPVAAAVMVPPGPDADAARAVCFGLSRVGAVQSFDPDLQARLAPAMTRFMETCTAWHEWVQTLPQRPGDPAHSIRVCQAECAMLGDYDRYILAQSPVAIDHVARLDEADRARRRAAIDAELRSLALQLRLARRVDTAPQGWAGWPDEVALETQQAGLREQREALEYPSVWAQLQTSYWRTGEAPQMMQCRSEAAITQRQARCQAACGGNAPLVASCVNPAPVWISRLVEALYPPGHPQRAAFEAQTGFASPAPSGPLPGGSAGPLSAGPAPLPVPVPFPVPEPIPLDPLPAAPPMPPPQPVVIEPDYPEPG